MKTFRNIALLSTLLLFIGSLTVQAQSITDEAKKEAAKKEAQVNQAKDDVKKKRDKATDEANAKVEAAKQNGKPMVQDSDMMKKLNEKLAKAKTEEEKAEIMAMIEAEKKKMGNMTKPPVKDGNSAVATAKGDNSSDEASKNDGEGNDYEKPRDEDEFKGREYGLKKVEKAKERMKVRQDDLAKKEAMVAKGKERVANARTRLAAAVAEGKYTEEEAAEKAAAIDRAEAGIKKLEASISAGRASFAKQNETLEGVLQDKEDN